MKLRLWLAVICAGPMMAFGADGWYLAWTRQLPNRQPTWMWASRLPQDIVDPIVEAPGLILVGTTADSSVRAYRRADGSLTWRYDSDGAIRWKPTVAGEVAVIGSDDGTVACVALRDGAVRWRYRPSPNQRQVIGHLRVQSAWPIMTEMTVAEGVVYGACGVFPDDGIWAFAVDLATGEERWLRRLSSRVGGRVAVDGDRVGFAGLDRGCYRAAGFNLVLKRADGSVAEGAPDAKGAVKPATFQQPLPPEGRPRLRRQVDGAFVEAAAVVALDVNAAVAGGAATAVPVPVTWRAGGPWQENLTLDERTDTTANTKTLELANGVLNFLPLYGEVAKQAGFLPLIGDEAFAQAEIQLPQAGSLAVNASADGQVRVSIDGQTVIDTLGIGNGGSPTNVAANTGLIDLPAGAHRITLRARPGTDGWTVRLALALVADPAAAGKQFPAKGSTGAPSDPLDSSSPLMWAGQADGSLVLLTKKHVLHGFTKAGAVTPTRLGEPPLIAPPALDADLARAADGAWVLVAGVKDGALAEALAASGKPAHLVVADGDAKAIAAVRQRLERAGLLAEGRVQVIGIDPASELLPPWAFNLVVSERALDWAKLTRLIRPHGGRLVLPAGTDARAVIGKARDLVAVANGVQRPGHVAGGADWSHELGDASNASGLHEPLVRFPLAVNWYGGPADDRANFPVPTKGTLEGTVMQPMGLLVNRGVWIQQGIGRLTAFDQYTGRELWQIELPKWFPYGGVGLHGPDANAKEPWRDPIANAKPVKPTELPRTGGFNMGADATTVYVGAARELIATDLHTGQVRGRFAVPASLPEAANLCWGTVRAVEGALVATLFHPDDLARSRVGWDGNGGGWAKDRQRMRHLVCLDPATGKLRWAVTAERGFVNHGVAVGGGKVFALDLLFGGVVKGLTVTTGAPVAGAEKGRVSAYDLATGKTVWQQDLPALLTDIVYHAERDTLMLPSRSNFQLKDGEWAPGALPGAAPGKSNANTGLLLALRGADGHELYRRSDLAYKEPYAVVGDRIVQRGGVELSASEGTVAKRPHPVTGAPATFTVASGGCTWLIQSDSYSSHRFGWTDLGNCLSGTYSGLDHGCVPALLPAGGLVNVSDVGSTRFGNRSKNTARTLVHTDLQTGWADDANLTRLVAVPAVVERLGVLPGAPGNRADDSGRWWLRMLPTGYVTTFPSKAAKGTPAATYEIAEHRLNGAANVAKSLPGWVGAWGLVGPSELSVPVMVPAGPLSAGDGPRYRLTLVVVEPDKAVRPGQRVFSVRCDGSVIAEAVDPVRLAGGARTAALITVEVVAKQPVLSLTLTPAAGSLPAVIGGIVLDRLH